MNTSNLKQKFIVTEDTFRLGRCVFHKDLARGEEKPLAGGSYYWDREEDVLYLYGASFDFGPATKEQIEKLMDDIKIRYFKDSKVVFEENPTKSLVVLLSEHMDQERAIGLVANNDFV